MNLFWGLNESGKSTWHAALYAALCGRPRRKGKPSRDDEDFELRHKPWDQAEWKVAAQVRLEDGRRIELVHNLLNVTESTVLDIDLGRDYRAEILYEGSLDGAHWLGLDRRSFVATACVYQADLLAIVRSSPHLQEQLQRAAATASADATAAQAITQLKEFFADNVGQDRRNSSKPLRTTIERVERARVALAAARSEHSEYTKLAAARNEFQDQARYISDQIETARAAAVIKEAEEWSDRLLKAREIAHRVSNLQTVPESVGVNIQQAAAALNSWRTRPTLPYLEGPSASELSAQIARLPERAPEGDLEPSSEVELAYSAVESLRQELKFHQSAKPQEVDISEANGASSEELRTLSAALSRPQPEVDQNKVDILGHLTRSLDQQANSYRKRTLTLQIAGGALIGAALALLVIHLLIPGVAAAVIGAALIVLSFTSHEPERLKGLAEEMARAEDDVRRREYEIEYWLKNRNEAVAHAQKLGLDPDTSALTALADKLDSSERVSAEIESWQSAHFEIAEQAAAAQERFWEVLSTHHKTDLADVTEALQQYRDACVRRSRVLVDIERRKQLQEQLRIREQLEQAYSQSVGKIDQAEAALRAAAKNCEIQDNGSQIDAPEELATSIQAWIDDQEARRLSRDREWAEWGDLQSLLAGMKFEDLEQETAARTVKAREVFARFGAQSLEPFLTSESSTDEMLQQLKQQAAETAESLAHVEGQMQERSKTMKSVAEAEEELEAARSELDRISRLKKTLETTTQFLERAQEQVHRSIAPVLRQAVGQRLPNVTAGRYWDVRVDPENLAVQVCGANGRFREATALSHGTAEQIYLLLRVALAERLTTPGEICPLLLDDVTVHSDSERTKAILECLQSISRERQVILFSQQTEVLDWARANLTGPNDAVVELDASEVAV